MHPPAPIIRQVLSTAPADNLDGMTMDIDNNFVARTIRWK